MSSEMWCSDGVSDLHIENAANFIRSMFFLWEQHKCNHEVSIVLFGRMHYPGATRAGFESDGSGQVFEDANGMLYQDFYKVVVDAARKTNLTRLLLLLKKAMAGFPQLVRESFSPDSKCTLIGVGLALADLPCLICSFPSGGGSRAM